MKHTRTLLAATLALTLASCGQQLSSPAPTAAAPQAKTEDGAIAGAYLVGFKQSGLSAQSVSEQAALQAQAITAAGGVMTSQWVDISAAAAKLSPEALAKLQANPLVEYVEPDLVRQALGFRSGTTDAAPKVSKGLSSQALTVAPYTANGEFTWGDEALRVEQLRAGGYTGQGVAVCITDTGFDGNHPEFQRKLKGFKNFITSEPNRNDPYALNDVNHHGTHVAGTIFAQMGAGTGAPLLQDGMNVNGVVGVATGVNIYAARVLGDDGRGSSSAIINGVNWCAAQLKSQGGTENKVVINMSLGGGGYSRTEQRAYTSVWNKGVFTVIATGNESTVVSYPAAYDNTVAVGAIDNTNAKADFSNFGPQVDLVGPGVDVYSSVPLNQGTRSYAGLGTGSSYVRFTNQVLSADKSSKGNVAGNVVAAGDGTGTAGGNQFCGTTTRNSALSGNIALISRGTCTFEEKVANAVASGAKAVMIYNNAAGELGLSLTNPYTIPVVGIFQTDGQNALAKLPTTGAVEVLDADYESYNGTSMATPHVAAASAVVWAAKPNLTNAQLLSLLTGTATDLGTAGKDDNFGYGLVNPLKAITGQ